MDGDAIPSSVTPGHPDIVVIGGSYGSLAPLQQILADLPADLPAALFIVQHRAPGARSSVPLLAKSAGLEVVEVDDHAQIQAGRAYVGRSDRHLLFRNDVVQAEHGPRENLARPSIDVLFRSAAVVYGARVIGVILSGGLDDGEHGLLAIQRCGGHTIVQDPTDAIGVDLPVAALRSHPNECLAASQIAAAITRVVGGPARAQPQIPEDLAVEARAASLSMMKPGEVIAVGEPTAFTCPECQGPLWRTQAGEEYRCHVGHAFNLEALNRGQALALERALWIAYRVINERARLLERMTESAETRGMAASVSSYQERSRELHGHSRAILDALAGIESPIDAERLPGG